MSSNDCWGTYRAEVVTTVSLPGGSCRHCLATEYVIAGGVIENVESLLFAYSHHEQ